MFCSVVDSQDKLYPKTCYCFFSRAPRDYDCPRLYLPLQELNAINSPDDFKHDSHLGLNIKIDRSRHSVINLPPKGDRSFKSIINNIKPPTIKPHDYE